MRPTVTEQLEHVRRLLRDDIAPAVLDDRASGLLQDVLVQLGLIAGFADDVLPFLDWDNRAMRQLLADAAAVVLPETAEIVRAALDRTAGPPCLRFAEADARNNDLRATLVALVQAQGLQDPDTELVHLRITAHLAERAARYPMRMTLTTPAAPSTLEA